MGLSDADPASSIDLPLLPLRIKISYALPRFAIRAAYLIIQVYGQLYYMQLGAKLRFMAFYTAIGRALDVITDPAMGWVTDSTRTSCGRRKPYLLLGMFLYTAAFGGLFHPPETSDANVLTHWYGCFYCLFFAMDTFANVPYYALGMELTSDYEQRNSLYFWQHVFGQLGTMIGGVLPAVLSDFLGFELRVAYLITGWSFGAWYSLGVLSNLLLIKERPAPKPTGSGSPPLAREMLRIYRNEAFGPWMMAYILDYAAIGILATMVPLFAQYVLVEPDDTNCKQQCEEWKPTESACTCASLATEWLGWIMAGTFLAAFVSVPFWQLVAKKFNKHIAWQLYSWFNVVTAPLRIFCGKGSLWLTISFSALNGSAFGGQFLGESVMADLSDYDEFLYGDRSEGMLGVVATLGPKMVLVLCSVVPLAAIATADFRDSVWSPEMLENDAAGKRACAESMHLQACPKIPQPQNEVVIWITRLGVSIIPTLFGLASNYFKWRFPLKRKEQLQQLLLGIEAHKQGRPGRDPITGKEVVIAVPRSDRQRRQMWQLEMWGAAVGGNANGLHQVLSANNCNSWKPVVDRNKVVDSRTWSGLKTRAWRWLVCGVILSSSSLAGVIACFPMLDTESTSWVPTALCICCGGSLVLTAISVLRLKAALALSRSEVSLAFLQQLVTRASAESDSGYPQALKATEISLVEAPAKLPVLTSNREALASLRDAGGKTSESSNLLKSMETDTGNDREYDEIPQNEASQQDFLCSSLFGCSPAPCSVGQPAATDESNCKISISASPQA